MMSGMAQRLVLVAVALLAGAYLAVQLRATQRLDEGKAIAFASPSPSPADARRAQSALDDAEALSSDATPDIYRAIVLGRAGQRARAAAVLEDVVRREPENVEAWGWLEAATRGRDPALAARARARLKELNPRVASRARR